MIEPEKSDAEWFVVDCGSTAGGEGGEMEGGERGIDEEEGAGNSEEGYIS